MTKAGSNKWVIDPSHTKVGFSVRHFGISETDGFFKDYSVTVKSEREDFSDLAVQVSIRVDSIDTNDAQRDAHLKAEDFFNAAVFPEMKFESTVLERVGTTGMYKLYGNLTIREVTKQVVFDLEYAGMVPQDPFGNTKAGFLISGAINRQEFGLSFNVLLGTGNLAVSDTVSIRVPVQLLKVAEHER